MKGAVKPRNDNQKVLEEAASRLKEQLKELMREYTRLAQDLETKRKARAERLKAERGEQPRERMDRIAAGIQASGQGATEQRQKLKAMKRLHNQNVRLMQQINARLKHVENQLGSGQADPSRMKGELQKMLGELQLMRRRREELLQQIEK